MAKKSPVRRLVALVVGLTIWSVVLAVGVLLVAEALRVRSMPALERWHEEAPPSEFAAADVRAGFTFADHLEREAAVFEEVRGFALDPERARTVSPIIRFVRGGKGDPATFEPDWNRTQILEPAGERLGGALLLHGLTDSPYSMRSTAEVLRDEGYLCLCLRFPGHGTVPAGILEANWQDWYEASKLAWRELETRAGKDGPLLLCGYSTGGAIAVLLAIEAIEQGARVPEAIILFSPAIGITPLAAASNVHRLYSWIPFYRKARWLSVQPEYDPFKYNSFPQHAGAQSWALTRELASALDRAAANGTLATLPPVLCFQSLVDSTIVARDLIARLFDRLAGDRHELVCFDVNRGHLLEGLLSASVPDLSGLIADPSRRYRLTILTNANPGGRGIEERDHPPRSTEAVRRPLDAAWPSQVFSLAHVAIPFPPDDPIYGDGGSRDATPRLKIGDLSMRGERGVLLVSADDLMRLRHNPFHALMMERLREWAACARRSDGP